ncbi:AAA family ATPase [Chryseobacterium polytrichastri]|uniref:ATPase family associated with various cellular activities (AAA) n=1 Tax=Chryseobacterium polytrichastri TaxID=1302687 RepID=A0A1M6V1W9_9FLAO|nr:AAA family ATPase [Chryseobacterium polytrichastri]SHK75391.1 ATPase family associated with various cellular activities (AAA) [Chryseobacterium polytrichastri]
MPEFFEFGKALLTIISYCDAKAYKKNELNQYVDKRVLALAYVRMNNWIEHLITYKFEGKLENGSIKNAIEYLLNPVDNFTMLSENHRSQISENLFGKDYHIASFKNDFIDFFSELSIEVKNPLNYTHLLTGISYGIISEWKESIIGLVCPDSTGWQSDAIEDTNSGNYIALWNHKKPNGTGNTLKLLRQCIEENGFFRIFYTSSYNVNYVAEIIDFAYNQNDLNKADWRNNYGYVEWFNNDLADYKDGSKSASWVYLARKIYEVNSKNYAEFKYHKSFGYPSVGCQAPVISYKTNVDIKKQTEMQNQINILKYKKQIILQGPPGTGKTRLAKEIAMQLVEFNIFNTKTISVKTLTKSYIQSNLKVGQKIEGKNNTMFEVVDFEKNVVLLKSETSKAWRPSYNKIIDSFNNRLWKIKGRTGGFKSYEDAIAKHFYENHLNSINEEEQSISNVKDFQKIIQFHPSYTYEDFVRGIVAKPNEEAEGIIYEAENKTIAKFAEDALNDSDNNYVLIIDEINRANLSSVLGELIYALEYRGEEVESMYEVDGSQKLVLPPNLYIIGTMNTADRSVGHIDYAIRRRFAFVDVLPKELQEDDEIYFNTNDFSKVSALFNESNVSKEFEIDAVQIGHSYFIVKKEDAVDGAKRDELFKMKMDYEVKPILLEYERDGILVGEYDKKPIREFIKSL